ncbi:PREDICTED: U11/U12 small nuclear ribonucleoprotein 25 kDa protein [Tarenaya hassleriana]|uniref:U11/U12 small nuclear ribonucleoprotein 25 kDa protein n=1 Tax=Tarenaya hassleriana TaxID=28532 RepID=UPI00053C29C6|nr:PREDICTED: U11/U12 small nuclear ribonucleoprotein 25 kDa protein [Tarenaya hassleriana]
MESFLRRSFSYDKLPTFPIRLSVLKLDGSSFDVQIKSTASIGDLKVAIEEAFDHVPKKGPAEISWSHVWGHFCLSFKGRKLVTDTDCVSSYGVEDGDQIKFIRHVSGDAAIAKGYSKRLKQQKPSELLLGLKNQGDKDREWKLLEGSRSF